MHIPEPSKKRLIRLSRLLQELNAQTLTSTRLQDLTGWTSTTIRKDLSYILNAETAAHTESGTHIGKSEQSRPEKPVRGKSNGYKRTDLLQAIQAVLFPAKNTRSEKCCIIGLGAFGKALIESRLLENSAFVIAAGFDASLNRVETLNAPFPLYALSHLERVIEGERIRYAVLSADTEDAPEAAERLIRCGIRGIVNYTSAVLPPSSNTKIENLSLPISLQNLAC